MAQITGHKIIREPVQITVDNQAIWNLIRNTVSKEFEQNGKIFLEDAGFYGTEYPRPVRLRDATIEELYYANAINYIEELFFKHCKD